MPRFMVSFAASIEADDEDEAKCIATELMRDPDRGVFNENFGCVIEIDEEGN